MLGIALAATAEPTTPMWVEVGGLIVQSIAVLVAVGASVVALVVSGRDRKALLAIARRDREHERLRTELEYAVRLSANHNVGGSTDRDETNRLAAEALALAGVVGERWVPRQYARAMGNKTPEELAAVLDGPETPESPWWVRDKIESGLAVQRIVAELYKED